MKPIATIGILLTIIIGISFGGIIQTIGEDTYPENSKVETAETSGKDNFDEHGNYFEGDIILPRPGPSGFSGIRSQSYRWPNAVIPFELDSTFSEKERSIIQAGMADITFHTCIKFVKHREQEDFIFIQKGATSSGCFAQLGRRGGQQEVNLSTPGCMKPGIVTHELLHTIGFYHEQSRSDRDDFVNVHYENIKPGRSRNFNKYGPGRVSNFRVSYDYGSIMHYSAFAFASSRDKPSITPRTKQSGKIGQRVKLSPKDIQKINNMYSCSA